MVVKTCPHEVEGRWKFPQWGLDPYWALSSVMLGPPLEGHHEFTTELDGEQWQLEVYYQKSGIAPRRTDDIDADRLYEWWIKGRGENERKASFKFSPRFPRMRHHESRDLLNLPWEHQVGEVEGMDVEFKSSNVEPDVLTGLLGAFYRALFEDVAEPVNPHHFDERPHEASTIHAYERYLRITREWAKKLISSGVMHKILLLLADVEGAQAEYSIDNEEVVGKMHRCQLRPVDAKELIPGHTRGKQLKNYLLKDANAVDKDHPSFHPKYGVLLNKKLNNGEAFGWYERDDLRDEIDETLINTLNWADVPIEPDGTGVFVADDHFDATTAEDDVELFDDPTPQLEAQKEHLLVTSLRNMTESDVAVLEDLVTDGGKNVQEVSDSTGYHVSTIYRALERLGDLLECDHGHIDFRARKFREELQAIVESTEAVVESAAERAQKIMGLPKRVADSSPFQKWLAENGAEIVDFNEHGDPARVRVDTVLSMLKASSYEHVSTIAQEAIDNWRRAGHDPAAIRQAELVWQNPSGETEVGFVGAIADR